MSGSGLGEVAPAASIVAALADSQPSWLTLPAADAEVPGQLRGALDAFDAGERQWLRTRLSLPIQRHGHGCSWPRIAWPAFTPSPRRRWRSASATACAWAWLRRPPTAPTLGKMGELRYIFDDEPADAEIDTDVAGTLRAT